MHSQQANTSTASNHAHNLIDRVLHLRGQLGIDIPLSLSDSQDSIPFPKERYESSMKTPEHTSSAYNSREWLVWSQSPGGENPPEKD